MANELITSGLGDILLTESQVGGEILLLLADRESLRNHPAILNLGDAAGSGSATGQISLGGLDGYDLMEATAGEIGSVSNTAFTDASVAPVVARQHIRYEMSNLAQSVDHLGVINPMRFAQSVVGSAQMRLQEMLAEIADDFTTTVGTSGVDCSVDDFYDAKFALQLASVPGPYIWEPHPVQYTDWVGDLRTEGGAAQYQQATNAQLALRGPGFQGSFQNVDIFTSTKVPLANASADRASGMWARGALGFREASIPNSNLARHAIFAGPIMVAFDYVVQTGITAVQGEYQVGVIIVEDARGVSVITDA